ncbi:HET-domain-containing protein [Tothia fuscella]|uniref:HET-domain-containing protein n=1 Tax=Tothia fuscella TaxID=1048955 RepID=A0A9P4U0I4_9PEZI|nr:HET-domain-containing protein [Tothia fuscella]
MTTQDRSALCPKCAAIPSVIFVGRKPPRSYFRKYSDELAEGSSDVVHSDVRKGMEARFQHYNGMQALDLLKASSDGGCPLCSILLSSLSASRRFVPSRTGRLNPIMPKRYPEEGGVTLHSFDENHFIVRAEHKRWSCIRFSGQSLMNENGTFSHASANDPKMFELIHEWIGQCYDNHISCTLHRINFEPGYVPARLIHVDHLNRKIRLVERNEIPVNKISGIEYIALSHCWGKDQKLIPRTTRANRLMRKDGIAWDELTNTFRDAMEICLKLWKPYIWIDSLCIVQDDEMDVRVHCASMSQVYSNAFCTVAATGAVDGSQGCFMKRTSTSQRSCWLTPTDADLAAQYDDNGIIRSMPQTFTILPTFKNWTSSLTGQPLLSRGWCLQERELSCRVLHFTADRVLWECRESYASEDNSSLETKNMLKDKGIKFRLLDGTPRDRKDRPYDYKFLKWLDSVEEYSTRHLSVQNDKLRAIAGLADAIRTIQVDDVYLSGLWKRDLFRQLLWRPVVTPAWIEYASECWPPPPIANGLPTWSWASYNGPVYFIRNTYQTDVIEASATTIVFSRPALKVHISEEDCARERCATRKKLYAIVSKGCGFDIFFDFNPAALQMTEFYCVIIGLLPRVQQPQTEDYLPGYQESSQQAAAIIPEYSEPNPSMRTSSALPSAASERDLFNGSEEAQNYALHKRIGRTIPTATGLVLMKLDDIQDGIRSKRVGVFLGYGAGISDLETIQIEIV